MRRIGSVAVLLWCGLLDGDDGGGFDHALFDGLLRAYVHQGGLVDYAGFEADDRFDRYLKRIADADLSSASDDEKLAFYINAYNALVIRNVIDHMPIDSPLSVPGFFKEKRFRVAGEWLTLDQLEYDRIFDLDRIWVHFGLVCAARSCPALPGSAYSASDVRDRLERNARTFLSDDRKNRLDADAGVMYLSQIFNWFRDAFESEYGSLPRFVAEVMGESESTLRDEMPKIEFMAYDWRLNRWTR